MMEKRPEQLRREYESEQRAAHYREHRWTRSARARRTDRKEQEIVRGFLTDAAKMGKSMQRILDLPCGTGRFRTLLLNHCEELWSGDASREMLAQAPPPTAFQISAHAVPLQEDAVDAVLCSRLLHHFEHSAERLQVLQELTRVSRRWIILSYFDSKNMQAWRNQRRGKLRGRFPISRAQFHSEIESAGLMECNRTYIARGFSEQVWVLLEKVQ